MTSVLYVAVKSGTLALILEERKPPEANKNDFDSKPLKMSPLPSVVLNNIA